LRWRDSRDRHDKTYMGEKGFRFPPEGVSGPKGQIWHRWARFKLLPRVSVFMEVSERVNRLDTGAMDYSTQWARVEFNVARLWDPSGWGLCPPEVAPELVVQLLKSLASTGGLVPVCPHVDDAGLLLGDLVDVDGLLHREGVRGCPLRECLEKNAGIYRLDIAMDFGGVRDPWLWPAALLAHRQPRRKSQSEYASGATVSTGKNGVDVCVYDKHREGVDKGYGGPSLAPPGTVRVEVRPANAALSRYKVSRIQQIASGDVRRLYLDYFARSGLDRWIGGSPDLRPHRSDPVTPIVLERTFRYLDDWATGRPTGATRQTEKKYLALTEALGLIPGLPPDRELGPLRRLDLLNATESSPDYAWRRNKGAVGMRRGPARTVVSRRSSQ
jgi:hypothetical protein